MNDQKAIEVAIAEFVRAYNAGNLEAVMSYYASDLIKLRQGSSRETKAETAQRVKTVFDQYNSRVDVVTDEIHVAGETAYTRGSFRVTLTLKGGGEPQTIDRRYLEIWRKEHGRWLVVRAMDNTQ